MAMYSQFEKDRDQGNFELLPELHAILSGMKVHTPMLPSSFSWVLGGRAVHYFCETHMQRKNHKGNV